jgi:prepilin-type N-terminal cleavage/methylation domain-containing protein
LSSTEDSYIYNQYVTSLGQKFPARGRPDGPAIGPNAQYGTFFAEKGVPATCFAHGRRMIMRKQNGFTLIEIAIVLVIIGLLLGGVLKGQELITSARVRNLVSTQDGMKAAYFGFLDRYRALPGDYSQSVANIPNCALCQVGNNDGQILLNGAVLESIAAWEHMSKAGFITGSFVYAATAAPANTPTNPYGTLMQLIFDAVYQDTAATARHNLKSGNNIPSDILAEVDRKMDDGLATGGAVRFSVFGGAVNTAQECFNTTTNTWQAASPGGNCGAATLF